MRCLNCPTTIHQSINQAYCWRVWRLCGKCAKEKHPHFYQRTNEANALRKRRSNLINKMKAKHELANKYAKQILELSRQIEEIEKIRQFELAETEQEILESQILKVKAKKLRLIQ